LAPGFQSFANPGTPGQNISGDVPQSVRKRIEELSSPDPVRRAAAACALGEMGERAVRAIPFLVLLLEDGTPIDPKYGCPNETPFEDELWQPDYEEVKEPSPGEAATQALIALYKYSMEPLVHTLLEGSHWRARKNAAWALAHRGDRGAVEALVAALTDEAWQVRAEAAYALFQRGGDGRTVVSALIGAMADEAWQVRAQAVMALGHKGSSPVDVVDPLISALEDKDARVREAAASGLWHTADHRAFGPLIQALKDEDRGVRASAARTLGNRVDNSGVDLLIGALDSKDKNVRQGAREALEIVKERARGKVTNIRMPNINPR
jgi:HEAT repeat protein